MSRLHPAKCLVRRAFLEELVAVRSRLGVADDPRPASLCTVPTVGFITQWLGEDTYPVGPFGQTFLPSRIVNVSDIEEIQEELARIFPRVEIQRTLGNNHDISADVTALTQPLVESSDAVLRSLQVDAYAEGSQYPQVQLIAGADRPAEILTRPADSASQMSEEDRLKHERAVSDAAVRVWRIVCKAGRRALGPRQQKDLANLALGVVMFVIFVWFVFAVRSLPVVIVGLLAMIAAYVTLRSAINRLIDRRLPTYQGRLVIRPVTRDEWRRQRWSRKRDVKVGVTTFMITAVATFAGTLALTDKLPSWWPF